MSEFKVDAITNRDGSYGPEVCGVTTFTSSGLTLPSGPTEFRKQNGIGRGMACIAGAQNSTVTINKVEIQTKGDATDLEILHRVERWVLDLGQRLVVYLWVEDCNQEML